MQVLSTVTACAQNVLRWREYKLSDACATRLLRCQAQIAACLTKRQPGAASTRPRCLFSSDAHDAHPPDPIVDRV